MSYKVVCVAGTFDGIHAGHEAILLKAFEAGDRVMIGLTSDAYVRAYKSGHALPYSIRFKALTAWIAARKWQKRVTIVSIDDPFEPAASSQEVDSLVVSEETKGRGEELNRMRVSGGCKPLTLIVVPIQKAEDGKAISSSRVRRGEVDVTGRLTMPDSMRDELSQPLGTVLSTAELQDESFIRNRERFVITVGDLTTKTILDAGTVVPGLMIIDHKVERKAYALLKPVFRDMGVPIRKVKSGPGYISNEAVEAIREAFHAGRSVVVEVSGEEDLLALPAVAEAPVGSVVYYGQPSIPAWACGPVTQGIVEVPVTEEKKTEVNALL